MKANKLQLHRAKERNKNIEAKRNAPKFIIHHGDLKPTITRL